MTQERYATHAPSPPLYHEALGHTRASPRDMGVERSRLDQLELNASRVTR